MIWISWLPQMVLSDVRNTHLNKYFVDRTKDFYVFFVARKSFIHIYDFENLKSFMFNAALVVTAA